MPEKSTYLDARPKAESPLCLVPPSVYEQVEQGLGRYFEPLCKIRSDILARDMLNPNKAVKHLEILRHTPIFGVSASWKSDRVTGPT